MRNLSLKNVSLNRSYLINGSGEAPRWSEMIRYFIFLFFIACHPKPTKDPWPDHFQPPVSETINKNETLAKALWFTSTNFTTGGTLGRLDLQSGEIRHEVKVIGADVIVIPDKVTKGLFLLNRSKQDAITSIHNPEGTMDSTFYFPENSNPQHALRDNEGRVWVTLLDSADVWVLSSDLKSKMSSVDLSGLRDAENPKESSPALSPMMLVNTETLWVGAQRLNRKSRVWTPAKKGGLAEINTKTLSLKSLRNLETTNPILFGKTKDQNVLIGAGDFNQIEGVPGGYLNIPLNVGTENLKLDFEKKEIKGAIIAGDFNSQFSDPFLIVWYPAENKSCVQMGETPILCDGDKNNGGYVFNSIRTQGNIIFVSYNNLKTSEIWMITLKEKNPESQVKEMFTAFASYNLQKITMKLPILSLSFGP